MHDHPKPSRSQNRITDLVHELRSLEKKKESAEAQQQPKLNQKTGILNDRLQDISCDLIVVKNCGFHAGRLAVFTGGYNFLQALLRKVKADCLRSSRRRSEE